MIETPAPEIELAEKASSLAAAGEGGAAKKLATNGEQVWLGLVIPELVPSPCIARGVDVPGSTLDCNMRGHP